MADLTDEQIDAVIEAVRRNIGGLAPANWLYRDAAAEGIRAALAAQQPSQGAEPHIKYGPLYVYAEGRGLDYNELCSLVRSVVAAPQPTAWPAGLIDRIKAAEQRVADGHAPRRIPADPNGDVDLVLAEVRLLLEGKPAPFWISGTSAPQPSRQALEPLTRQERVKAWGEADGMRTGYGPVMDAAIRIFCKKNGLELRAPAAQGATE